MSPVLVGILGCGVMLLLIFLGMPIAWVPIRTIYFPDRQSGFRPVSDTLLFLRMVWRIRQERARHDCHG